MEEKILTMKIERLREQLYRYVKKFGLKDNLTLAKSRELDNTLEAYYLIVLN